MRQDRDSNISHSEQKLLAGSPSIAYAANELSLIDINEGIPAPHRQGSITVQNEDITNFNVDITPTIKDPVDRYLARKVGGIDDAIESATPSKM